jgi:hypothetical protein
MFWWWHETQPLDSKNFWLDASSSARLRSAAARASTAAPGSFARAGADVVEISMPGGEAVSLRNHFGRRSSRRLICPP